MLPAVNISQRIYPNTNENSSDEGRKGGIPFEEWLPLTESRNGNIFTCIFHLVNAGIKTPQALTLPLAFATLGWAWGSIAFVVVFAWQLYTTWLLVQLHESPSGTRCSRYLRLTIVAFGPKLGKLLGLFPVMYLSGATCINAIILSGSIMKPLLLILCGDDHQQCNPRAVTVVEWHLVFIVAATLISCRLPNLNSVAWVSLSGAITAIVYCFFLWILPICKNRPLGLSHQPNGGFHDTTEVMSIFSALGTIAFAFRGHNLVLEIEVQKHEAFNINFRGTLPTSSKNPPRITMWRAVIVAYTLVAITLFSLGIGGFWAYGILIPRGGLLSAFTMFYRHGSYKSMLAIIYFIIIINSLCLFQIYGMVVFDNLELRFTGKKNKPCTVLNRAALRAFFGAVAFFVSVALPFLPKLAALLGGLALPLTFVYPCFMWIAIKKPGQFSPMWWLNWVVGCLGIVLSALVVTSAIYNLAKHGLDANFFHPK
ncbi:hypothetical protein Ancab_028138 [Ancistrocladus abbreviatus]